MGILKLSKAPKIINAVYSDYFPWLAENFYDNVCAYCLLKTGQPEIDHYEPPKMSPRKRHSPLNLVLACGKCNGAAGKSDYHPEHMKRRARKNDKSGFKIIDIRAEDFAILFKISEDGKIDARLGSELQRAIWNIAALNLNSDFPTRERKDLIGFMKLALDAISDEVYLKQDLNLQKHLGVLLDMITRQELFYYCYGIELPKKLRDEIRKRKRAISIPTQSLW